MIPCVSSAIPPGLRPRDAGEVVEKDAALKGFSDFMRSEVGAEDTVVMKWQRGAEFSRRMAHRNRCFTY